MCETSAQSVVNWFIDIAIIQIMAKQQKFYVVWKGVEPGIYTSWTDCQLQIKNYKGAIYKSFTTREEAEHAFATPAYVYLKKSQTATHEPEEKKIPENFDLNCLAVDAACSGNPGPMEYRGVYLLTGQEIFHFGPMYGTNNIGEFLAIVHGLALMKQKGINMPIYSDSRNALNWVKQKKCKTKLERTAKTEELFQLIERAEKWLNENQYTTPLRKWETDLWGEVPADFGRKLFSAEICRQGTEYGGNTRYEGWETSHGACPATALTDSPVPKPNHQVQLCCQGRRKS